MTTQFELKTRYLLTEIKHRRPLRKFHPLYLKEQQRITNKRKLIPNSKKQKNITIRWKKGMYGARDRPEWNENNIVRNWYSGRMQDKKNTK